MIFIVREQASMDHDDRESTYYDGISVLNEQWSITYEINHCRGDAERRHLAY